MTRNLMFSCWKKVERQRPIISTISWFKDIRTSFTLPRIPSLTALQSVLNYWSKCTFGTRDGLQRLVLTDFMLLARCSWALRWDVHSSINTSSEPPPPAKMGFPPSLVFVQPQCVASMLAAFKAKVPAGLFVAVLFVCFSEIAHPNANQGQNRIAWFINCFQPSFLRWWEK